jgi:hypothetical protein
MRAGASFLEALFVLACIIVAVLWVRDSSGPYEPFLALLAALATAMEVLRRYLRSRMLRVFLSVGATYTKEQEDFVAAFERVMTESKIERLVAGRDNPPSRQPVLEIRDLMRRADAVIVIAFTRYVVHSGTQKPGANLPKHKQAPICEEKHPTVWNQIEAGIAFGLGLPVLLILEEGIKQEAMLKDRLEFRAISTPLDPSLFTSPEFTKQFSDFNRRVRRRSLFQL